MVHPRKSIIRIFGASGARPRGRRRLDRNDGSTRALNPAGERIERRQVLLIANADILEALRVFLVIQRWGFLRLALPRPQASQ